jgi:hypothetical protein
MTSTEEITAIVRMRATSRTPTTVRTPTTAGMPEIAWVSRNANNSWDACKSREASYSRVANNRRDSLKHFLDTLNLTVVDADFFTNTSLEIIKRYPYFLLAFLAKETLMEHSLIPQGQCNTCHNSSEKE